MTTFRQATSKLINRIEAMKTFPFRYIGLILTTSALTGGPFTIFDYNDPEELYIYLKNLTRIYPNITSLINLGLTYEKRPIYCLKISKGNESVGKIIAEYGAHAREWPSHTSATHVIHELLGNDDYDELITKITWYIIPLLNPDGFKFSKTDDSDWRKNRRPNPSNGKCPGVDINRNFPVKWFEQGTICSEDYAGPKPFSESETMAIQRLFTIIPEGKVDLYISVHTDAQCIILPYAYTYKRPPGYESLCEVAKKMKNAMEIVGYPKYSIIRAAEMYQVSGTVFDWVFDHKGVPLTFTLELPFSSEQHQRFKANGSELVVIAKQCLAALRACALDIMHRKLLQGPAVRPIKAKTIEPRFNSCAKSCRPAGNTNLIYSSRMIAVVSLITYLGNRRH